MPRMKKTPGIPFDLNRDSNGSPLYDPSDSYQYDGENGDEDLSDDESMSIIDIEGGEEDPVTYDEPMKKVKDHDDIPAGWKFVEVAGSYDEFDAAGGGGFVLRDWDDATLLAQAFPAPGYSLLLVEAYAVHRAMESIIALRETEVAFCLESELLFNCIRYKHVPDGIPMIRDCINWCTQKKNSFHVILSEREGLEAAVWLSNCGRRCRQHCQWDSARPWPPGLGSLM